MLPMCSVKQTASDNKRRNIKPISISEKRNKNYPINLLLLHCEESGTSHYTYIRKLDKLLQYDKHKKKFCPFCCYGKLCIS